MGKVKGNSGDNDRLKLLDKAKTLPTRAGCYLMRNAFDQIIYVGKAKSLRSRVSSYFNSSAKNPKTEILVSHIVNFEFLVTDTEAEALVLENNLIKKHSPKYNIQLKDDKAYPYVVIDHGHQFPRVDYRRNVKRAKNRELLGPFVSGSNISEVLKILIKRFRLRTCKDREFKLRKEPCLLYQMKQCSAPCCNLIDQADYANDLKEVTAFLKGKGSKVLGVLEAKMLEAAESEEFELAASIRDDIGVLTAFLETNTKQKVQDLESDRDLDIVAYYHGDQEVEVAIYLMRNGAILGHKNFHLSLLQFEDDIEDELMAYLMQYYSETSDLLPTKIVLPFSKEKRTLAEEAINLMISERDSKKISILGSDGKFKQLYRLTHEQARESQKVRLANQDSVFIGLTRLAELLKLKERPITMECYDIAIWQGSSPAASQVVFHEGKPAKSKYRYYHLEERAEGNNDFAMMKEVMLRRIKYGDLPDLFVVDGGKGQVSSFIEVLKECNVDIPVVGIAKARTLEGENGFKDKSISKSDERLIIPGRLNPYTLSRCPSLFRILVQMRDEAHRFSRKLHHNAEKKRVLHSWCDEISGIGPVTKKKILKQNDLPIEEIAHMSVDEIMKYFDVSRKIADKIFLYWKDRSS